MEDEGIGVAIYEALGRVPPPVDIQQFKKFSVHFELHKVRQHFTDRISKEGNAIASICLSVRPFVSTLSSEPTDR